MKVVISLLFLVVTMLNAGYITPPLQAVLDTLSPGNKTIVCVHLVEKPSLSRFQQKAYAQKIAYLKEVSQRIQRPLIIFVNTFGNQIDSLKSFWVFNGLSFQGTKNAILAVASRHDVEFVSGSDMMLEENPLGGFEPPERQVEWNILKVEADHVWSSPYGYTGKRHPSQSRKRLFPYNVQFAG